VSSRTPDLPERAWSTADAAEQYERARPGYAAEAIAFIGAKLGLNSTKRVLDVGAGTGKLTRQIAALGVDVVAVEPLEGMSQVFERTTANVPLLIGSAEALPLPDASVDAVVAGQAWHWFDSSRALAEVSRVLRPAGGIALFWNEYDEAARWVSEYAKIRSRAAERAGGPRQSHTEEEWRKAFASRGEWSDLRRDAFPHAVEVTRQTFVERVLSSSVFAVQSEGERLATRAEILELLERTVPHGSDVISVPYITEVFWALFRPAAPAPP
jgi:ubiquinone/menaquinone biosynthesis C-methylase UbiE